MKEQDDFFIEGVRFNTDLLNFYLPSLKNIYVSECKLTRIDKNLFSDLPNLEELYLKKNELIKLDKDLFKNLAALKILELNYNKIIGSQIVK